MATDKMDVASSAVDAFPRRKFTAGDACQGTFGPTLCLGYAIFIDCDRLPFPVSEVMHISSAHSEPFSAACRGIDRQLELIEAAVSHYLW
jgi:hypothetical protein